MKMKRKFHPLSLTSDGNIRMVCSYGLSVLVSMVNSVIDFRAELLRFLQCRKSVGYSEVLRAKDE